MANLHKINAINYIQWNRKYEMYSNAIGRWSPLTNHQSKTKNNTKQNLFFVHWSCHHSFDTSNFNISSHRRLIRYQHLFYHSFQSLIHVCKWNWQFVSYKAIINYNDTLWHRARIVHYCYDTLYDVRINKISALFPYVSQNIIIIMNNCNVRRWADIDVACLMAQSKIKNRIQNGQMEKWLIEHYVWSMILMTYGFRFTYLLCRAVCASTP